MLVDYKLLYSLRVGYYFFIRYIVRCWYKLNNYDMGIIR